MTANGQHIIRLEFSSAFEMLDFVQVVSDHLARTVGLDDDALHWVSVAIRESVINAIKHGNKSDASKHVFVEFETGGGDAQPGRNWVERTDGTVEMLSATAYAEVQPGDRFVIETPGGGGFGRTGK